ncbi:hypothetical protein FV242_09975 [Methylobacterium sp. WL64]|uniref:hypothetical protein n=1 Tax=Methylobacterium sp. WL64 TaxID=2603894 RepID=UPI0011CADFBA|nr:hypothetical protein [Methylobacterium sp. WL64]TXN03824.1 hypothetical protein FV242_09975 [Methylobacterium sp. WL64]
MLDGELMTAEVGNPALPLNWEVERANRVTDYRFDLAPERRSPPLREVSRTGITELATEADLRKFAEQYDQFTGVVRIAEPRDQIRLPDQASLGNGLAVLVVLRNREIEHLDGTDHATRVDEVVCFEAHPQLQLRAPDVMGRMRCVRGGLPPEKWLFAKFGGLGWWKGCRKVAPG